MVRLSLLAATLMASLAVAAIDLEDFPSAVATNSTAGPVDAVLFRTHLLDPLIVHKLAEMVHSLGLSVSLPGGDAAPRYELTLLYDAEMLKSEQHVKDKLREFGFEADGSGIQFLGLSLRDFTRYPAVKPLPVSKSHQQHLGYTTWWEFRGGGEASPRKVNY